MGCTPLMALLPHAQHLPPHSTRFLQFAELGLPVAPSEPKPSISLRGAGKQGSQSVLGDKAGGNGDWGRLKRGDGELRRDFRELQAVPGEVVSVLWWRFPSAALESQLLDQHCGCCGCGRGRSSPAWEGNGRRGGDTTLV